MKNFLHLLFLVGVWSSGAPAAAQSDQTLIHIDKPVYVNGETIWYSLFLPNAVGTAPVSIRVQVLNPMGEVVEEYVDLIRDGVIRGGLPLPIDRPSGVYRLRFSGVSASSPAKTIELGLVSVPCFNDLELNPETPSSDTHRTQPPPLPASTLSVEVIPGKSRYSPRDPVQATIRVRDTGGRPVSARLSVAVVDDGLCGEAVLPSPTVFVSRVSMSAGERLDSMVQVSGRILDSLNHPLPTPFLAANLQPAGALLFTSTDSSGRFQFRFPPPSASGFLQLLDYRQAQVSIAPEPPLSLPPTPPPVFTAGVNQYLESSRQRKKIDQLFDALTRPAAPASASPLPFPDTPDQRLSPGEFTSMKDLPTFFRDVSTPLKFRREGDRYVARMFNPQYGARSFYPGEPLFLVDGVFTRDASFVAGLDITKIDRIDLFYRSANLRRRFGALGRFGVVRISSRDNSLARPPGIDATLRTIPGLQPAASFPLLSLGERPEEDPVPVFRPQVFWSPVLSTDPNGLATLSFPQTDDRGRFRIRVVAVDEQGIFGIGEAFYEVN